MFRMGMGSGTRHVGIRSTFGVLEIFEVFEALGVSTAKSVALFRIWATLCVAVFLGTIVGCRGAATNTEICIQRNGVEPRCQSSPLIVIPPGDRTRIALTTQPSTSAIIRIDLTLATPLESKPHDKDLVLWFDVEKNEKTATQFLWSNNSQAFRYVSAQNPSVSVTVPAKFPVQGIAISGWNNKAKLAISHINVTATDRICTTGTTVASAQTPAASSAFTPTSQSTDVCTRTRAQGTATQEADRVVLIKGSRNRAFVDLFTQVPVTRGATGRVTLDWSADEAEGPKAAILEFDFFDRLGRRVYPMRPALLGLAQRLNNTWYQYVSPPHGRQSTVHVFDIPLGAESTSIRLRSWVNASDIQFFGADLRFSNSARSVEFEPNVCGNGVIDENEACDGGRWPAFRGCTPDCTHAVRCGDGVKESWEACDDGHCGPLCDQFARDGQGRIKPDAFAAELPNNGVDWLRYWTHREDPRAAPEVLNLPSRSDLIAGLKEHVLRFGKYPPVPFEKIPDWAIAKSVDDPTWKLYFHAQNWLRIALENQILEPDDIRTLVIRWIEQHPPQRFDPLLAWDDAAVAWRLEAWVHLARVLPRSFRSDETFAQLWMGSMIEHAAYLDRLLQDPSFHAGNHALFHARALLVFVTQFPEVGRAAIWREHAVRRMAQLVDELAFADGFSVEEAAHYHMALAGFLRRIRTAMEEIDNPTPEEQAVLKKSTERLQGVLRAAATLFASGSLFRFGDSPQFEDWETVISAWTIGFEPYRSDVLAHRFPPAQVPETVWYEDAGYGFLLHRAGGSRSRPSRFSQLFFDASDQGAFHGHFDAGNFLLNDEKGEVIGERGGPLHYSADAQRTEVLASSGHNLCLPVGADRQVPGSPKARWFSNIDACRIVGIQHELFPDLPVQREIAVIGEDIFVVDQLPAYEQGFRCRLFASPDGKWEASPGDSRVHALVRRNEHARTWFVSAATSSTASTASTSEAEATTTASAKPSSSSSPSTVVVKDWTTPEFYKTVDAWVLEQKIPSSRSSTTLVQLISSAGEAVEMPRPGRYCTKNACIQISEDKDRRIERCDVLKP
ncbi:MAG: heparinase II/III family protein [Deltaproteobacteria bacterium]|nr:heparinase II/III family protein [Deltaproteobacteria bacterium]